MENIKENYKMVLAEPEGGGRRGNRRFLYPTRDHSPASIHSSHLEEGVE